MSSIYAWCKCGHYEQCHPDGGPCTFRHETWDDELQSVETIGGCRCTSLELEDVELVP